MTRLILIRHGESAVTVKRVIGGPRSCSGLSELGRLQAHRLHDRLAATEELAGGVLISSAYPRAIQTAEIIADTVAGPVTVDAEFGEHDPGPTCDGMSFGEFLTTYGSPDWETDPHDVSFPGGETVAEFHHRVGRALARVVRQHAGCAIVVTCHGGVIDAGFRWLLGLPMTGRFELHTLNTSITELVRTRPDRWRLVRYNDAGHLAGLPIETPRADPPAPEAEP